MLILHAIGTLEGGGAETQLSILLRNLLNTNLKNAVISYTKTTDKKSKFNQYYLDKSSSLIKKWGAVYAILKKEKPEIIHIWIPAVFHVYLLPALFYRKAKIILGIRSSYRLSSLKRFIHLMLYIPVKNVLANTHLDDQKGFFKWVFRKKNYKYIPNATKFNYDFTPNFYQSKDEIEILFVGRLVSLKNIDLLLKAIAELQAQYNTRLNICGDGPLKASLSELAKTLGISDKVRFNGHVKNLIPFYHRANILVLPSNREGMPNVVFEALAFNVIPVLSDLPQHKRWFTNSKSAIFFKNNDVNSLNKALATAVNLEKLEIERITDANRSIVLSLSKEKFCRAYYEHYKSILEHGKS